MKSAAESFDAAKESSEPDGGPLSIRDFRFFYGAQSLSAIGDSIATLALAFGVLAISASPTALGLVLLSSRVPVIAFAVVGGAASDLVSRRTVLVAADLVRVVSQLIIGFMLLTDRAEVWHLALLAMLGGMGTAFFMPAAAGLLPRLLPEQLLMRANSLLGLSRSASQIGALAIGGAVVAITGPGIAFLIDAVTFLLSAILIALMGSEVFELPVERGKNLLNQVRTGVRQVRSAQWIWTSFAYNAITNAVVIAPFLVLGPLIAERELGGAASWATLGVAAAVGSLSGNAVSLRWKPQRPLVAMYGVTFLVVPLLVLLGIPATLWVLAPAAFLGMAQNSLFNVFHQSTLQSNVPTESLSTISSINIVGSLVAVPIGMALAGPLAELVGTRPLLWASAVWVITAGLVAQLLPSTRSVFIASSPIEPAAA